MKILKDTIARVSRHETGHSVAARVLGFQTENITYVITDYRGGHRGGSAITLTQDLRESGPVEYLRRRVKVLYAGVLAESLTDGVINGDLALEYIKQGGAVDHAKVRELIHLLRNLELGEFGDELEAQDQLSKLDLQLWNEAAEIVANESRLIVTVSKFVASRFNDVGVEVCVTNSDLLSIAAYCDRFKA